MCGSLIGLIYHLIISKIKPWRNARMIYVKPLPLKLVHLEFIASEVESNGISIYVFSLDKDLEEFSRCLP